MENVYLYNIDDLQTIANNYLKQRQRRSPVRGHHCGRVKGLLVQIRPHPTGGMARDAWCVKGCHDYNDWMNGVPEQSSQ